MDRADEGLGLGLGLRLAVGLGLALGRRLGVEGEDARRGRIVVGAQDRADEGLELLEVERAGAILVKLLDLSLHLFKTRLGRV